MMERFFNKFAEVTVPIGGPDGIHIPTADANSSSLNEGLQILFGIAGGIAVLIIAISAFRIITSRGNAQDVSRARDAIIYASIGLVICMTAFILVRFVVESL